MDGEISGRGRKRLNEEAEKNEGVLNLTDDCAMQYANSLENKGSSEHHNYSIGQSCRTGSFQRLCSACNLNDVHTTESNVEKIYRFRYTEIKLLMT
ncbi:hypothetical protein POWCR01_000011200 [Plasmodium ovale]|uniref:Uncharacterized protein n=1 Tax=Plasmodium ovale TaxID=36330 RepID=A0A1C3KEX7_PLAOA|nr:hypothetical protein POWCR01_000011200 [Plasmodium ovale]